MTTPPSSPQARPGQTEAPAEPWTLPVDIRVTRNSRPVLLTRVERKDDGSWMLETRAAAGARRRHHLTDDEFGEVTVVGRPEPDHVEPPAPVEQEVNEQEVREDTDPHWNDPERMWADPDWQWTDPYRLRDEAGASDGDEPDPADLELEAGAAAARDRRLWTVLCGSMLVLGGLAAGAQAGIEGVRSDSPVVATGGPSDAIADPFVGFPGDLDGRALATRPDLAWDVDSGGLEVRDGGGGAIATDVDSGPSIGIVRPGVAIEKVTATFDAVPALGGIVFRYQDTDNHWRLVGVPGFQTWSLQRVVDGDAETVSDTGLSGGERISVTLSGPIIEVAVEGEIRATVEDDVLAASRAFGITLPAGDAEPVAALEIVAEPG